MSKATKKQLAAIHAIQRARGWDDEAYRAAMTYYGISSAADMSVAQASDFISSFGTKLSKVPAARALSAASPRVGAHIYIGRGDGTPNGHLTQGQADAIAKSEGLLGWNADRTRFWIQKALHKSCTVEMLMQFEARKLIHIMARILGTKKEPETE